MCFRKTHRHESTIRRFRHGLAWHIGTLWIELAVPLQRCTRCNFTFTYDYGLGLIRSSTASFRREIVRRCQGRALSDVAWEYDVPDTTLERWFYSYATSVLNAKSGRVLPIMPHSDQTAITSILAKITGNIKAVVSDLAPAMANAIQSVFQKAVHILDCFHLIQFFTESLRRRRRYLNEAKKHHKVRFIDRCLARCPSDLTEEERWFVEQWYREDGHVKHLYQSLQHIQIDNDDTIPKAIKKSVQTVSISCLECCLKNC
ncbi:hypothetical protein COF51_28370 [Bacillus pseudomycoides]|nr:hypothetical protein COF51_28370 [Bacillus pseudomycoides]